MDLGFKDRFLLLWQMYFGAAELPLAFYYTDEIDRAELVEKPSQHLCFIAALTKVRNGRPLCYDVDSIGCRGGKRYLGLTDQGIPRFEYFLSCGVPDKVKGERYKKTPELARELIEQQPPTISDGKYLVFKRWDQLDEYDEPAVVIFFAKPDVLSGLYHLANYDAHELNAVYSPFTAGCSSIVHYAYNEYKSTDPRAVMGMLDVTARPFVRADEMTISIPIQKFTAMVDNMKGSFLDLPDWQKVKKRIDKTTN